MDEDTKTKDMALNGPRILRWLRLESFDQIYHTLRNLFCQKDLASSCHRFSSHKVMMMHS